MANGRPMCGICFESKSSRSSVVVKTSKMSQYLCLCLIKCILLNAFISVSLCDNISLRIVFYDNSTLEFDKYRDSNLSLAGHQSSLKWKTQSESNRSASTRQGQGNLWSDLCDHKCNNLQFKPCQVTEEHCICISAPCKGSASAPVISIR